MHGREPSVFAVTPIPAAPGLVPPGELADPVTPETRFELTEELTAADVEVDRDHVSSRAWRALAVASLGTVLVGFNSTATNIALKDITDAFPSASTATIGWVVAGYLIGTAAFLPLGGRLADRLGRKLVFQGGLLLFVVSALASAAAPTPLLLTLARVLQAMAGAMVLPSSLALVLPMFPESRRPGAVGLWSAAGPLAAGVAPTLAAWLLDISNWRVVYGVSAPMAVGLFLVGATTLRELPKADSTSPLDLVGATSGTLGVAAVVTAIMQGRIWGYGDPLTIVVAIVGVVGLAVFVRSSLRHPEPLLNLQLLRRRGLWVTNAANFTTSITSLSIWLVWPLFLRNIWGYSTFAVGLGVTSGPIAAGTSTVIFSRLADRFGQLRFIRLGSFIMVAAVSWHLWRLDAGGSYWVDFLPGIAGFGVGWGMASPLQNSLALSWVEQERWGETNGLFNTLRYAAAAFGTAVVFALLDTTGGIEAIPSYRRVLLFFVFANAVAAATMLLPIGRAPTREE